MLDSTHILSSPEVISPMSFKDSKDDGDCSLQRIYSITSSFYSDLNVNDFVTYNLNMFGIVNIEMSHSDGRIILSPEHPLFNGDVYYTQMFFNDIPGEIIHSNEKGIVFRAENIKATIMCLQTLLIDCVVAHDAQVGCT